MKVGYQGAYIRVKNWLMVNDPMSYRFNQGVPNQVTFRLPELHLSDLTGNGTLYVQDKWTRGRLTLQGALRYDRAWSWTPAEHNGTELTSRFNAAPISFPRTPGVDSFNDITPRFGAAYDVFGTGKTALKFNLGHYLDAATNDSEYTSNSPAARIVRAASRNWDDRTFPVGDPRRDNKVVDCDILNFAANGECPALTGNDANFGGVSGTLTQVNPETLHGWNVRQSDWQWGITVQQEVIPRVSAEVAYNRRWFLGAKVTDNTLRGPDDYEAFTITAPQDPRLPGGGGYPITLLMVTQAAANRGTQNYVTFETGLRPGADALLARRRFHGERAPPPGSDSAVRDTDRPRRRGHLRDATGTSTDGGTIKDLRNCHDVDPFQTTIRGLASYTIPKVDVLVSGTVRSQPPIERSRQLGGAEHPDPEPVSDGCLRVATPPAPRPSTSWTPTICCIADNRRTQIDMRFAKIFRFGGKRAGFWRGPRQPAEHQLRDDVREHVSVHCRQYGAGRHVGQPDGHLLAALRPLEPDGRLLIQSSRTRSPGARRRAA